MTYLRMILIPLLFMAAPISAQSPSCYDPMEIPGRCLPWGYIDLTSELGGDGAPDRYAVADLSRDGSTIAGVRLPAAPPKVFRWRLGEGARVFDSAGAGISNPEPTLNGPITSETGSFIVGQGSVSDETRVFRWDVEAGDDSAMVLPIGPAQVPSEPDVIVTPRDLAFISGDGQTIVGSGRAFDGSGDLYEPFWPFVWTSTGGTDGGLHQDFNFLFQPFVVDGIGSRIAGVEFTSNIPSEGRAAFWTASGGSTVVGSFPESRFTASSYDGEVLAGNRIVSSELIGFRWTSSGGPEDITDFGFQPRAVSDNGNLISGSTTFLVGSARVPIVWTTSFGAEVLDDYLFASFGIDGLKDRIGNLNDHAIVSGDGNVFSMSGAQWVAKVSPLQAVVMGDSYSSGEGASEAYLQGTDEEGDPSANPPTKKNLCHRSVRAYGVLMKPPSSLVTYQLLETTEGTGFSWEFIACSGARTYNVLSTGAPTYPGEEEQLEQGAVNADTDLVTITIGGNDALFTLVLNTCAKNDLIPPLANCFDEIYPGTTETFGDLLEAQIRGPVTDAVTEVYEEIKSQSMDNATVVALGYPLLLSDAMGCPGAPGITGDERDDIRRLGGLLNKQLSFAARRAGVHFIPEVAREFRGHNVCDSEPWIGGFNPLRRKMSWFHPTAEGQLAYARVLERFFRTKVRLDFDQGFFESGMPRNPVPVP